MATINLRAYNREIEGLIEQNQFDEAIAHCLHILQFIPKHIGTYRLLGKAFLESKRYGDAIDIFQRLLSSVPDDFVAHVGMSIIREDEGNLDSAIWHMERAFEAQPSNPMIQDELRRLYGRRDGLTPPKIRLTRGALARMYIRGMLYQQAIAELRAALAEDPQRLDLQVLLAQAYYASNQTIEAVNTCNALLKKLPYCLEANRIMAAVMPDTDLSEEAKAYRQRLISMDPYYSKISPQYPTSNEVPDKEVVIDHLDYRPGVRPAGVASQPAWAASLGVEIEEQKEALPDWLLAEEGTIPPLPPESEEAEFPLPEEKTAETQEAAIPADEDQIPDWLKSAGWQPATEPETPPPPLEEIETPEMALEISEAEIPEWLKEMAPSEEPAEAVPPEGEMPEAEIPVWLEEKEPGVSDSVILWLGEKQAQEKAPEAEEAEPTTLPEWLSSLEMEKPEITEQTEAPTEELPEWMQSLEAEQPKPAQVQPVEEIPSWLGEKEEEETGVTDWLERQARLRAEQAEAERAGEKETPPSEEIPEWLKGLEFEAPAEEMPAMAQPSEEEALEEAVEAPAEPAAEIPEWLKGLEFEAPAEEMPAMTQPAEEEALEEAVEASAEPAAEIPEWLKGLEFEAPAEEMPAMTQPAEEEAIEEAEAAPAEAPSFDEQALAWLESLAQKQGVPEGQLVSKPEERPSEMPEWVLESALEGTMEEIPAEESKEEVPEWLLEAEETKEAEQPTVEEAVGEAFEKDMEGAFEWLESLARKQGVPEDQLATHPLKPIEEPPEWVKEEAVTAQIPVSEEEAVTQEVPEEAPAFAEEVLPSWLVKEGMPPTMPEEETLPSAISEEPQPIKLAEEETLLFEPEQAAEVPIAKVDINNATLSQLEALPGVGFVLAQAILAYRETNGPFKSVDDLNYVPGFSPDRLEMIRDLIEVLPGEVSITIEERIGEPRDEQESILMQARSAILQGDLQSALDRYTALVIQNAYLNEIVADLQESLYKYPREILLWQTLGDAYLRLDQLQEALNAYIQAEELLG